MPSAGAAVPHHGAAKLEQSHARDLMKLKQRLFLPGQRNRVLDHSVTPYVIRIRNTQYAVFFQYYCNKASIATKSHEY